MNTPCEISSAVTLVSLADYTRPELIIPQLRETDPAGIIEELSFRLRAHAMVGDVLTFYNDVINREFLSNSAMSAGIATPHARSAQVRRLTMAVGRAPEPVVWGMRGSRPVELVFLIAVPSTDAVDCFSVLSGIANLGGQSKILAHLRVASDAQEIFELLKERNPLPG